MSTPTPPVTTIDMTPIELPSVEQIKADESPVVRIVDLLLHELFALAPGRLEVVQDDPASHEEIPWIFYPALGGGDPVEVMRCPRVIFRGALARISKHYMNDQVWAGYMRRIFKKGDLLMETAFYLSNENLSGFWLRIYVSRPAPATALAPEPLDLG